MSTLLVSTKSYKILKQATKRSPTLVTAVQIQIPCIQQTFGTSNSSKISLQAITSSGFNTWTNTQQKPQTSKHLNKSSITQSLPLVCSHNYSSFHRYESVMDAPPGIFRGSIDRFDGLTVESKVEYEPDVNFSEKLEKSLSYWLENKRRAVWFKVQTNHAEWVPHLTKHGFIFHHVQDDCLILCRWLPTDESFNIPHYAHTMIGVGGLVINEKNEILVVSDRFALIPKSWKMPGGYVDPGENLIDAAIREVHEETGVVAKFNTVVSIRHTHGGNFNCSDFYVVIALTPTTSELQRCEREIARLSWMPVAEYLEHPHVHETNRHFVRTYLDYQKRGVRFTCEKGKHQILKKDYCLYFMKQIEAPEQNDTKDVKV